MTPISTGQQTQARTQQAATRRIETLRIARAHLQTPVLYYTHPDTGRRIMIVGMHHTGAPEYYAEATVLIDRFAAAGGVVQCEG